MNIKSQATSSELRKLKTRNRVSHEDGINTLSSPGNRWIHHIMLCETRNEPGWKCGTISQTLLAFPQHLPIKRLIIDIMLLYFMGVS